MTFDKAEYTISFEEPYSAERAASNALDCTSTHCAIEKLVCSDEGRTLTLIIHADAHVIPVWEDEFKDRLPQSASIDCDFTGAGDRSLVETP